MSNITAVFSRYQCLRGVENQHAKGVGADEEVYINKSFMNI